MEFVLDQVQADLAVACADLVAALEPYVERSAFPLGREVLAAILAVQLEPEIENSTLNHDLESTSYCAISHSYINLETN